jgi:transposase
VADAGYDSESHHEFCRDDIDIRTIIPPSHGRPTTKPVRGRCRHLMQTRFNEAVYGQRWQVETVFSMIKRKQGDWTSGRSYYSRRRDMMMLAITHSLIIIIIYTKGPFPQSIPVPFSSSLHLFAICRVGHAYFTHNHTEGNH